MPAQASTTYRACVLTSAHAHYGDGAVTPLRTGLSTDLASVLNGTLTRFDRHSTIVIDDAELHDVYASAPAAAEAGWKHTEAGAWTLWRHGEDQAERTVAVGVRRAMDPVRHLSVLFNSDTDPAALALLLDRYIRIVGAAWRGTCATTALAMIRLSWENSRGRPLWRPRYVGPGNGAGRIEWRRPLNQWESTWGYVHTFDANAAYLGAMINAEVAWSNLEHSGPIRFDAGLPGYWLLDLDKSTVEDDPRSPGRPPLVDPLRLLRIPGRDTDTGAWVTTPMAKFLAELQGGTVRVVDSWTGAAVVRESDGKQLHGPKSRVLLPFGEKMRDARAAVLELAPGTLRDILADAVKHTYKDAVGGLQRETMRIHRPDWAHTIIDQWRATILRKILRVHSTEGVWPVQILTDSLAYADCSGRPGVLGDALGLGAGLGMWKHQATVNTATWLHDHPDRPERPKPRPRTRATRPARVKAGV